MDLSDNLLFVLYIAPIIGNVLVLVLIAFGAQGASKSKTFLVPIGFMALWLLAQLAAQYMPAYGLEFVRIAAALASVMALAFYIAIKFYTNTQRSLYTDVGLSIVTAVFVILSLGNTTILQVSASPLGISIDASSMIYVLQLLFMVAVIGLALYDLMRVTHRLPSKSGRMGNYIMFVSVLQALVIAGGVSIFLSGYTILQIVLYISGLLFSVGIFIGIFRHGLFDVRQAIVRTASYVLVLAVLAGVYYAVAFAVSTLLFGGEASSSVSLSPINVVLALGLAFAFQPLKRFFDQVTSRVFYHDSYNIDDFFSQLNRILNSTTDLRMLLQVAADKIGRTLKSEQTFFFIYTDDGHFVTGGTSRHSELPKQDALTLNAVDMSKTNIIVASLLEPTDPIHRLMVSHKLEVILRLVQSDETIGYLCLGEHLTSGYASRDMKVLGAVADGLVIAIDNALSLHEVRELNSSLQQRINEATKELRASNNLLKRLDEAKDEFVSMASHQLRTPLTSVKGYISMVLEGDAGKVLPAQRKLLDEAFSSSERMVRLINDFLNVSRIQTGKFIIDKHPTDLAQVVGQELDSLAASAASRGLKFAYRPPKNFPNLNVDEGKLRQVIMNFADNAIYYSAENSKIIVKLAAQGKDAVLTVKDTGIGVPRAEQSQLFKKFYRASNARRQRPDGTGVGLYLAKKVIDAHDGKLVFESSEGKGSTFGFRLPLQ